jgi:hypothetical protein
MRLFHFGVIKSIARRGQAPLAILSKQTPLSTPSGQPKPVNEAEAKHAADRPRREVSKFLGPPRNRAGTGDLLSLPVAPRVHEALEFLAVLCVAKIFHILGEFLLGGDEPLAFFLETRKFCGTPLIKSTVAC